MGRVKMAPTQSVGLQPFHDVADFFLVVILHMDRALNNEDAL